MPPDSGVVYVLRRILLAVREEAAKRDVVIFLCQHETYQTTLLHLLTVNK